MGVRLRAPSATAVALAGVAEPARGALSATGGGPTDPTRSLIAAVPRGTTVGLHERPAAGGSARVPAGPFRLADPARGPRPPRRLARGQHRGGGQTRPRLAPALGGAAERHVLPAHVRSRRGGSSCADGPRLCSPPASPSASSAPPTPTGRFGITDRLSGPPLQRRLRLLRARDLDDPDKRAARMAGRQPDRAARNQLARSFGRAVSTGCVRVGEEPLRALMRGCRSARRSRSGAERAERDASR